ncbi:MAG: cytochrome c-type biogenesis protein CcmH [Ectothiorhodospiraceae bacterium]|nr:cytochrome c-type biogenesis protein CcmH [Ectothiorhodospiraceae bacterium]
MSNPRGAIRALVVAAALVAANLVGVAEATPFDPKAFSSPEHEARYRTLIEELRCLVCQNQNIADSDAELASDLRREVHRMIEEGATNDDVVDFMVVRYGDFVRYRPPLRASTIALWVGPFVLAAIGIVLLFTQLRRRRQATAEAPLDARERARLAALLDGDREERPSA